MLGPFLAQPTLPMSEVPPLRAPKIIFANQLRGIAALSVVITHYLAIYFSMQDAVAGWTFSPNFHFVPPPWTSYLDFRHFNFGPFGVAVFFLISGFVIPFSLAKLSPRRFLIARFFRIYPTYLVCFAISCAVVWISAHLYETPYVWSKSALLANVLLLHTNLGIASLDLVNWTLAIEIKFYLLMAVFGAAVLQRGFLRLFLFAALVLGVTLLLRIAPLNILVLGLRAVFVELNFVVFMSIGILFYQHMSGLLTNAALVVRVVLLTALFSLSWIFGARHEEAVAIIQNYYFALGLFTASYAARAYFTRFRLLDFFADISYPLYLIHSLFGYVSMKWLMHHGFNYAVALPLTLVTVSALAYLIHRLVELPTAQLGKQPPEMPAAAPEAISRA
jgi:peptidoglycan/LPS O-acetylase OafA/YrhL